MTKQLPLSADFIYNSYKRQRIDKSELDVQTTLLINSIISNSSAFPIKKLADLFLKDCFKLRMIFIQKVGLKQLNAVTSNVISTEMVSSLSYGTSLGVTYGEVIELINAYSSGDEVRQVIEKGINEETVITTPSYNEFLSVLSTLGNNFVSFFKSSLYVDVYSIITKLVLEKEITLDSEQVKTLNQSLFQSAEEFGYYSSVIGIWTPSEDDEFVLARNIKIRLAMAGDCSGSITLDELKELYL